MMQVRREGKQEEGGMLGVSNEKGGDWEFKNFSSVICHKENQFWIEQVFKLPGNLSRLDFKQFLYSCFLLKYLLLFFFFVFHSLCIAYNFVVTYLYLTVMAALYLICQRPTAMMSYMLSLISKLNLPF